MRHGPRYELHACHVPCERSVRHVRCDEMYDMCVTDNTDDGPQWSGISRESKYHDEANSSRNCRPTLWHRPLSARGDLQSHPLVGPAQAFGRLTQAEGPEGPMAPVATTGSYKKAWNMVVPPDNTTLAYKSLQCRGFRWLLYQ